MLNPIELQEATRELFIEIEERGTQEEEPNKPTV
jgi:hypothetical protein